MQLPLLLQALDQLGHVLESSLDVGTGLVQFVNELFRMAVLLDPLSSRDLGFLALELLQFAEQGFNSLHVDHDPLRVHEFEHLANVLDLHCDILMLTAGLPVTKEVVDKVHALVQRVQLNQSRHMVLSSVNYQRDRGFFGCIGRLLFQLVYYLLKCETRFGACRFVY